MSDPAPRPISGLTDTPTASNSGPVSCPDVHIINIGDLPGVAARKQDVLLVLYLNKFYKLQAKTTPRSSSTFTVQHGAA